jgi:20S proteasome alpha/beta subunit
MNYGVPLYTIEKNGFSFPISLAYVGGGGIKVEEVASSAGLGWSLNSTGVISRSIRGLADDIHGVGSTYIGYIHLPDIPLPVDSVYDLYYDYAHNKLDAQPDLYNVSVPGISAQFYIDKNKKVMFLEKTDIRLDPIFSGYELIAFKMKDLNGRTYYFETKEQSKSLVHESAPAEYDDYTTSSWYLTRVESEYGKQLLSFEYSTASTEQQLRSPAQYKGLFDAPFAENSTTWSTVYTYKRTLSKIVFDLGEVDFIMSDSTRYDLKNDRYIKRIVVKNSNADTIKHFQFYHSYFSSNGTIQQGSGIAGGNYRLKLDSLKEFSLKGGQPLSYRFIYDTSNYLPDRMTSFAMDHWGYYNGQSTNTTWEAKHRVKYYSQETPGYYGGAMVTRFEDFGSANRAPSLAHTQAGVLTAVSTPTGGKIKFNYELHTSSDSLLPNYMDGTNFFATLDFQPNYFKIELINEPFGYVKVQSAIQYNTYSYYYDIYDSLTGGYPIFSDTLKYGASSKMHKLAKGTYYIKVNRQGTHPDDPSYNHFVRVYVDKETPLANKLVGGLRIRSMEIIDSAFGTNLVRNYYYNEAGDAGSSATTGTISNPPSYGMQIVTFWSSVYAPSLSDFFTNTYRVLPNGYYRTLTSAYPIGVTSGSHVGYGKVTTVDSNALKTESYFTTFKTFSEYSEGIYYTGATYSDETTINGVTYETHPYAPFDERDFLRGRLIRQIIYEKKDTSFRKLTDTENTYGFNVGFKTKNKNGITVYHLPDSLQFVYGMVFQLAPVMGEGATPAMTFKKYFLYTTSYALKKTITKNYAYQPSADSLLTETNYYYEDSPWFRDTALHYLPTKIVTTTSKGKETIKNYYPYHWRYTVPEATSPDLTTYKALDTLNRIGVPVVQVKEDSASATHLITVKNNYSALAGSKLALNKIGRKDGPGSLRDLVSFNQYDTLGNILEQQKTNDVKESYIWDYKNSYPIAQVTNASFSSIAFTSFESDGKGNWSYTGTPALDVTSPTGKKAFTIVNGSNNITKSGLSTSSTYVVSYWKKSGTIAVNGATPVTGRSINGWTYYEHTIVNPSGGLITVSGTNGVIDELRLYPASAQMTTYTFSPLIGMTSQCDANNRISYYEYDNFNRLSLVRDGDRNILKKICYNYAGQPEDCGLIVYSNVAKSGNFTRNNCGTNGTGGTVTYTVAAGIYTSTISQADADQKAVDAVNAGGQAYANANGGCTWVNQAQSGNFTRNNCGTNGTGSTVTYNVAAGLYNSTISLADANQKAVNAVNAGGQAYANTNGSCTWTNQAQSGNFTRNNCGTNGTGSTVTYNVAAGLYNSTISLADANQKAVDAVNAGGQAYANTNGSCTWTNQAQSGNFTRNNCGTNGTGSTVTYNVAAGLYNSTISLADANQKAVDAVNAGGQAYANTNGSCTWTNQAQSGNFTRNNCPANYSGSSVTYNVAANTYNSTISLADANQKAIDDVNANGQAYANTNGTCISNCNAGNCTGESKKCINGVCETGIRVNTDTYYNGTQWVCTYHYEWSDGSWSINYTSYGTKQCPL